MARLRTRWNQKERDRSLEEIASAIGVNIWRIAGEGLLNLENEGFETISHAQRLDVIGEFVAFLIHMTDRLVYDKFAQDQRQNLILAVATHLTDVMQDNRVDASGPDQYRKTFIGLVNSRMDDYSDCSFSAQEGPGFGLRRIFGDYVRQQMGAKDNKWIPDYVMDIEVPRAMESLTKVLQSMLDLTQEAHIPPVSPGGIWGEG